MELAARLACPVCLGPLQTEWQVLVCSACARRFPIVDGVPDLLVSEQVAPAQLETIAEWEEGAEAYQAMWRALGPGRLAPIDRPLLDAAAGDVVEVGCGDGRLLEQVAGPHVRSRLGVEPARPLAAAAARRGLDVVRAAAEALPLADRSVDVVLAGFYALRYVDLDAALTEAARVLRPGGRLAFTLVGRRAARLAATATALPLFLDARRRRTAAELLLGLGAPAAMPNDVDGAGALRSRLAGHGLAVDDLLGTPYLPLASSALARLVGRRLPYLRGGLAAFGYDVVVLAHRL